MKSCVLWYRLLQPLLPILRLTVLPIRFLVSILLLLLFLCSDGSATESEIINAIITEVNTNHDTYLTATLVGSEAIIQEVNQGYTCTFDVGTDWDISKVKKSVECYVYRDWP